MRPKISFSGFEKLQIVTTLLGSPQVTSGERQRENVPYQPCSNFRDVQSERTQRQNRSSGEYRGVSPSPAFLHCLAVDILVILVSEGRPDHLYVMA